MGSHYWDLFFLDCSDSSCEYGYISECSILRWMKVSLICVDWVRCLEKGKLKYAVHHHWVSARNIPLAAPLLLVKSCWLVVAVKVIEFMKSGSQWTDEISINLTLSHHLCSAHKIRILAGKLVLYICIPITINHHMRFFIKYSIMNTI